MINALVNFYLLDKHATEIVVDDILNFMCCRR